MSNSIEVHNLSKKYIIGKQLKGSLRESLGSIFQAKAKRDFFWALHDVQFNVNQGEAFGIIGRNGAGKSTLLKVLSKITTPTKGRIVLDGRMASLLEVGTGFHPELTGRENIFLNGTILGMTKKEVRKRLDEIIDFSGVEKFIDTPVKRYSSGMYVRLAFAVAAHLEPEILVVDEVLAVGDLEFQKKCLGKMENVSREGRTVLFVSHNMDIMRNLCSKGLLLNKGRVEHLGEMDSVIEKYQMMVKTTSLKPPYPDLLESVLVNINGQDLNSFYSIKGSYLTIEVEISFKEISPIPYLDIAFYTSSRSKLFAFQSDKNLINKRENDKKNYRYKVEIDLKNMNGGYHFDLGLRYGNQYFYLWQEVSSFEISVDNDFKFTNDSMISPIINLDLE